VPLLDHPRPVFSRDIVQAPAEQTGCQQDLVAIALFRKALSEFVSAEVESPHPRLIEAVLRTSRNLASSSTRISTEDHWSLCRIAHRYRAFGTEGFERADTYADARGLLRELFF
jgi:hypothetical protein